MQVALLDGHPVVAFDLTETEFAQVKDRYRADRSCLKFSDGLQAVPRSGKSVGAHFAHMPGQAGSTEPETVHHVTAKRVVRDVAISRGWTAEIEARHPDGIWQADVLVSRRGRRVAFEVQWSPQTVEEYAFRTDRYRESGVEVIWLAKYTHRTWFDISHAIPSLPFRPAGIGTRTIRPLDEVIDACFTHLETAIEIPPDAPRVMKGECYRCGNPFGYHDRFDAWGDKEPFTPTELQALGRWAGRLKRTYSQTIRKTYTMWHCPRCGAKQGDFYLRGEPYAIVDNRLTRDTRELTLWLQLKVALHQASRQTGNRQIDLPNNHLV